MKKNQIVITANQNSTISIKDRGLNYGDGFFTTAKIVNEKIEHWQYHKARLIECATRLGFETIDFVELENHIHKLISQCSLNVLKIIVTRGEGGRGYNLPSESKLTILVSVLDFPSHYQQLNDIGLIVEVSPIKLGMQPLLAGLKTLNRIEQVLIKKAMQRQRCDDVIVLDYNDNVIEASAANIFIIKDQAIITPNLDNCGIRGVYLQSLCDKLPVKFMRLTINDLIAADAVFICNSLMGSVPVKCIEQHTFDVAHSQLLLDSLLAKEIKC